MCKASVYEARNNFSTLVKTARSGEPVELTRHDKTVAIIISYEEFEKAHQKQNLMEKLEGLRKQYANLDFDDDDGIPLVRIKEYPDPKKFDHLFD